MHEFSIAVNIVDIAIEHAEKANARRVNEVELEIGELSGVVYDAMETAMEAAIKGTLLDGAEVKIIRIGGRGLCSGCGKEFEIANLFDPCPWCGAFNPEVVAGKELRITSINVD
jgi:hydrogenase nickel incorporation protein HypA/HybF